MVKLITFFPDEGSRGPIVVNQDQIDGITEEYGKAIIHAGSLRFRVWESQREVCEMLQKIEDTVTVTRCKDCKRHEKPGDCDYGKQPDDWFCADGIPKGGC